MVNAIKHDFYLFSINKFRVFLKPFQWPPKMKQWLQIPQSSFLLFKILSYSLNIYNHLNWISTNISKAIDLNFSHKVTRFFSPALLRCNWCITFFKCKVCAISQSCPNVCNAMDCNPPGSSVHGILQGKNTGVACHALLQGIFPTQGSNPDFPHCRWFLYHLSHQGSPRMLEWVAYPFFRGPSQPKNQTRVSHLAGRFFIILSHQGSPMFKVCNMFIWYLHIILKWLSQQS